MLIPDGLGDGKKEKNLEVNKMGLLRLVKKAKDFFSPFEKEEEKICEVLKKDFLEFSTITQNLLKEKISQLEDEIIGEVIFCESERIIHKIGGEQ